MGTRCQGVPFGFTSGPSCSKLMMSLVNVSLNLSSSNMAYRLIFLLKKCE